VAVVKAVIILSGIRFIGNFKQPKTRFRLCVQFSGLEERDMMFLGLGTFRQDKFSNGIVLSINEGLLDHGV